MHGLGQLRLPGTSKQSLAIPLTVVGDCGTRLDGDACRALGGYGRRLGGQVARTRRQDDDRTSATNSFFLVPMNPPLGKGTWLDPESGRDLIKVDNEAADGEWEGRRVLNTTAEPSPIGLGKKGLNKQRTMALALPRCRNPSV